MKKVIVNLYKKHSRIIYNGNSYTEEWENEAKRRGLKNIKRAPEAFKAFLTEDSISMFEEFNVYKENELISRYHIKLEKYIQNVSTEVKVMIEIAKQDVLPQVIKYAGFLMDSYDKLEVMTFLEEKIYLISELANLLDKKIKELQDCFEKFSSIQDLEKRAEFCSNILKEKMSELREIVDTLEDNLPREYWPMPTYSDLLN